MGDGDGEAGGSTTAGMTRLKARIADLIGAQGPITVADYMALCLFDPKDGYYTTREPFGVAGDFITAPEISQMFGELVAVWLVEAWHRIGQPIPVTVAEIGPGRGTLARDELRTMQKLEPRLADSARFALVETSPRLAGVQRQTLAGARIEWHETVATLPPAPLLIVGNELFDAIPPRQFVRVAGAWRERVVGLDDAGELMLMAGAGSLDPALLPKAASNAPDGAIFEIAPGRTALVSTIADRIALHGGAGLFFDYGHLEPGLGDTLQAVRSHGHEDVLASPGEADLTSHVDFAALAAAVRAAGLDAHLTTQGDFLLAMGLLERAGALGATADETTRHAIRQAATRLAAADAMGTLFKVLKILPRGMADIPAGDGHAVAT